MRVKERRLRAEWILFCCGWSAMVTPTPMGRERVEISIVQSRPLDYLVILLLIPLLTRNPRVISTVEQACTAGEDMEESGFACDFVSEHIFFSLPSWALHWKRRYPWNGALLSSQLALFSLSAFCTMLVDSKLVVNIRSLQRTWMAVQRPYHQPNLAISIPSTFKVVCKVSHIAKKKNHPMALTSYVLERTTQPPQQRRAQCGFLARPFCADPRS
ncbi:hypothetical protein V8C34DRAFT_295381 [Trichoderma compactum]